MSFARTVVRRARRTHRCDECRNLIPVGVRYADRVASPGYVGNTGWWRIAECELCAIRLGHAFTTTTHRCPL